MTASSKTFKFKKLLKRNQIISKNVGILKIICHSTKKTENSKRTANVGFSAVREPFDTRMYPHVL